MTARFRPLHSSFETLRHAGSALRMPFNSFGSAVICSLAAAGYGHKTRPAQIFADFIQR